jgi:hypothetical protein
MKTFLVICALLIGFACYASGPVLRDCDAASVTVTQTIDPVMPVYTLEVPEIGMPLQSAELAGYDADIWHPPVLNSTSWLKINNFDLLVFYDPIAKQDWRCQVKLNPYSNGNKVFHICWFDVA